MNWEKIVLIAVLVIGVLDVVLAFSRLLKKQRKVQQSGDCSPLFVI